MGPRSSYLILKRRVREINPTRNHRDEEGKFPCLQCVSRTEILSITGIERFNDMDRRLIQPFILEIQCTGTQFGFYSPRI